ncbi:MAG: hypothetical protein ACOVNU_02750 [Candidatus Kapaibacteriota bacterium]
MAQHYLLYIGLALLIGIITLIVFLKIKFALKKSYFKGYAHGFKQASFEINKKEEVKVKPVEVKSISVSSLPIFKHLYETRLDCK